MSDQNGATVLNRPPSSDVPPAYLASEPPPWAVRAVSKVLIAIAVAAALFALVVPLPETVTSAFTLVPRGGTDPVRAPRDGVIHELRVKESEHVNQGQVLAKLRSDEVGDRSGELATLRLQVNGAKQSLGNARQKYDSQTKADEDELRRLRARRSATAIKLAGTKKVHTLQEESEKLAVSMAEQDIDCLEREKQYRQKVESEEVRLALQGTKLLENHALSDLENTRIQLEAARSRLDLRQTERELSTAKLKLTQLQAEQQSKRTERAIVLDQLETDGRDSEAAIAKLQHQMEAANREFVELDRSLKETESRCAVRIATLEGELGRSHENELLITSPCAGFVLRLQVKSAGAYVRAGELVCELAGEGEPLQAELRVGQSAIGRIQRNHRVKLRFDSFPYQRYDVQWATVRWVSPASVETGEGPQFRVLADIDTDGLDVDGKWRLFLAGMSGRADVVVYRRTLASYAFEPVRQLRATMAADRAVPSGNRDGGK
jgi:multidrug efflux pump subunit AcrA (membrane-fusion protein)